MVSKILKSGSSFNHGKRNAHMYQMEGWILGMESAIMRSNVSMIEYLMQLATDLPIKISCKIKGLIELTLREGQTSILWILLDAPAALTGFTKAELARHVLEYYASCYEQDAQLTIDKDFVKNIRGRDTKGILPVLRGIVSHRGIPLPSTTMRNLLLMAATWNLNSTYGFLEEYGAHLGHEVEPLVEFVLRLMRAPTHFEIPATHLIMKIVVHPQTSSRLFGYQDGLVLRTLALPQCTNFLCRKGRPVWEIAVQLTPVSVFSEVLSMMPRCEEFAFIPPSRPTKEIVT
ncbi:hypothetical protein BC830DRAFT_1079373 [Chytriomyces sp. MP71]|nr:hypothetical protein BC830DRAFT_1079373 [Chytriomyces sp. MP71]